MSTESEQIEPTVEIDGGAFPEIMRILRFGADVDAYLVDIGVRPEIYGETAQSEVLVGCGTEKGELAGSLLGVVGAAGGSATALVAAETVVAPVSAVEEVVATLLVTVESEDKLAACTEGKHPEAAAKLRADSKMTRAGIDRVKERLGGTAASR